MIKFTDKYQSGLDKIYSRLLLGYKEKQSSILEIGIGGGGSLLMYQEILPDAKIYGIDIIPRPNCLEGTNIKTKVLNQNDSVGLDDIGIEAGGFDIIIDDGSHFTKETKNCFDILWKYLRPGGIYVIEDWIIGILLKNNSNKSYMESTNDMDKLIFDIVSKKTELGIRAIEIVLKEDTASYAVFKK